jgi:hypothetical protein
VTLLVAVSKRRRKFQLATVHEKHTNDLLAEVLSISFGPVVVYSTGFGASSRNTVMVGSRQYRGGRPIAPLTGEINQSFDVISHSNASYEPLGVDLLRVIAEDADPAGGGTSAYLSSRCVRLAAICSAKSK